MMKQRSSFPVLTANGQPSSNTPLGRSTSINSSLSSFHPVFLSSSCSNFVSPSHLSLKKIKPEPWQRLFEGKKQQDLSIKKNQSNIDTVTTEDFINVLTERSIFDENSQGSFVSAPIQTHIDQLYEQIDDLTLQLTEERFRHKQIRIKIEEKFSKQLKEREKKFQEQLQQILLNHQNELKEHEKKYFTLFNDEQIQCYKREEQLRNELDFLKKSFHTYKINLDKNNMEQLQIKINEALEVTKEKLPEKEEQEINKRINEALDKQKKLMNEKQKIDIENIRKQYENKIATMQKSFTDATVDQKRLELLNRDLVLTKLELHETKEREISLSVRLQDLECQHIRIIRELSEYRMRFDEQTKEIEKLCVERVDQFH